MEDKERYNLLYKPFLRPERQHRSEATFKGNIAEIPPEYFPPEDTYDYIEDYKELEDLIPGLPEDLAPLGEIVPFLRVRAEVLDQERRLRAGIPQKQPIIRVAPTGSVEEPKISVTIGGGGDIPGTDITTIGNGERSTTSTASGGPTGTTSTPISSGGGRDRSTYTVKPPDRDGSKTIRIFVPTEGGIGSSGSGTSSIGSSGGDYSIPDSLSSGILPPDQYTALVDIITTPSGTIYEYEVPSYYDDAFDWHRSELEDIAGSTFSPEENTAVYVGTNMTEEIETIDGLPPVIPQPTNITIEVTTPKSIVETIQESYTRDQIDLQKRYLESMRSALQKYFQHQLAVLAELNIGDLDMLTKDYDGDNVSVSNSALKHLHDTIIRSQIQRKQKALYFKKTANTDFTLTHMRAWNAAEKSRERYYSETYGTSDNFIDSESNALLRQARADYDAAYNNGLYNMMKYLNSSVEITEDILNHVISESKAKAKLIQNGVNIYATEEFEYPDDGVSTTQPKTADQAAAEKSSGSASSNKGDSSAQKDPATLDKAYNIEDPADEKVWGVSPIGCHYSKNDISYLESLGGIYNTTTTEGRAAIKMTLDQSTKYANDNTNNTSDTTKNSSNNKTNNNTVNGEATNKGNTDTKNKSANIVDSLIQSGIKMTTENLNGTWGQNSSNTDSQDSTKQSGYDILKDRLAINGLENYDITVFNQLASTTYEIHKKYPEAIFPNIWINKSSSKGKIWISKDVSGNDKYTDKEIEANEVLKAALQYAKNELSSFNMNVKEE